MECHQLFDSAEETVAFPGTDEETVLVTALLASLSQGLLYLDAGGTVRIINRTAESMLQVSRAAVIGKRIDMLPLRSSLYKVFSDRCRNGSVELSCNGKVFAVRSTMLESVQRSAYGEVIELQDITAEKRERRQREEFVAMMTHDLKSPLTVMMGYIQALKHDIIGSVDGTLHFSIEELDRSSHKLLVMIDDMLDAFRLEVGLLQVNREPCDIRSILQGCCRDFAREARAHGVELTYAIDPEIPLLRADGKQLARVFSNLTGNAIKFTAHGGTVSLAASVRDGYIQVAIQDTGIGIPPQELGKIFHKYYRANGASGFKGTGLGLTISKAIVEAHCGSIGVDSVEGSGSRFTVTLPLESVPVS